MFAGGCATGTWYRAGEGLLGSWIALIGYMTMSAMMKSGALLPVNNTFQSAQLSSNSMAETTGLSVWVFIVAFVAIVLAIVIREQRKPKIAIPSMKPKRTGLAHLLFEKRWHPFFTALLVGLIAILAWPLSEATGRMAGLGITTPSANILQFLVTGNISLINWVFSIVLGFLGL